MKNFSIKTSFIISLLASNFAWASGIDQSGIDQNYLEDNPALLNAPSADNFTFYLPTLSIQSDDTIPNPIATTPLPVTHNKTVNPNAGPVFGRIQKFIWRPYNDLIVLIADMPNQSIYQILWFNLKPEEKNYFDNNPQSKRYQRSCYQRKNNLRLGERSGMVSSRRSFLESLVAETLTMNTSEAIASIWMRFTPTQKNYFKAEESKNLLHQHIINIRQELQKVSQPKELSAVGIVLTQPDIPIPLNAGAAGPERSQEFALDADALIFISQTLSTLNVPTQESIVSLPGFTTNIDPIPQPSKQIDVTPLSRESQITHATALQNEETINLKAYRYDIEYTLAMPTEDVAEILWKKFTNKERLYLENQKNMDTFLNSLHRERELLKQEAQSLIINHRIQPTPNRVNLYANPAHFLPQSNSQAPKRIKLSRE